jgi:hypothetical protein
METRLGELNVLLLIRFIGPGKLRPELTIPSKIMAAQLIANRDALSTEEPSIDQHV